MELTSKPHGQHQVVLLESHESPGMRIFEIRDAPGLGYGRLGFTGEELDWLASWWLAERGSESQAARREIDGLRSLDGAGLEWEWTCGPHDFHVQFDEDTGSWLLEKFVTKEANAAAAHLDERECETLQDALLFSLET